MAIVTINEMLVQPQSLGEVFLASMPVAGPASYTRGSGNGQKVSANAFGLLSFRFVVAEDIDNTETYVVRIVQAGKGATTFFRVRWYTLASGGATEVTNATNLSGSSIS